MPEEGHQPIRAQHQPRPSISSITAPREICAECCNANGGNNCALVEELIILSVGKSLDQKSSKVSPVILTVFVCCCLW